MARSIIGFVDSSGLVHSVERDGGLVVSSPAGGPTAVTGTDIGRVTTPVPETALEAAIAAAEVQRTEVTSIDDGDSPYTVASSDRVILCDTDGGAISVQLPSPATFEGLLSVKDTVDASANNITILRDDSEEINGAAASHVISTQRGSVTLCSDGTDWWIVD